MMQKNGVLSVLLMVMIHPVSWEQQEKDASCWRHFIAGSGFMPADLFSNYWPVNTNLPPYFNTEENKCPGKFVSGLDCISVKNSDLR